MDNMDVDMDNTNQALYDRINRLIGDYTIELPAQAISNTGIDKKNPIKLDWIHELLEPHEINIGKSYYAIDIKDKENVNKAQIKTYRGKFYSSGPFQNFGKLTEILHNNLLGYTYYFEYGKTEDDYDPNATYGSKHPHYYLYLDQETINKPLEIPPENVFKISDDAINVPFYKTDVRRVAGKKRKTRKSRKSRKTGKTTRHKKKSKH